MRSHNFAFRHYGFLVITALAAGCGGGGTGQPQPAAQPAAQPAVDNKPAAILDIATDALDPNDRSDTEPSIAVNPTDPNDIAIVAFSEPWSADTKAPVWRSSDGGKTWKKLLVIPQIGNGLAGPGDQKIAFTSTGRLVLAELGSDANDAIHDSILREVDDQHPVAVTASYGNDQPHVDVDRMTGGSCFERIYSPWLNTKDSSKSMVTYSNNGNLSPLTDTLVGDDFPNRTTRIAVSEGGKAYVLYKTREGAVDSDFEKAHFRVKRSDDCGKTWTGLGPTAVSVHGPTQAITYFTVHFGNQAKGKVARARSSDGWIAAASGIVAASYVNKDSSGHAQIYVATSSDQGVTWTTKRVTDGKSNAAFPEVAIAGDKALGVLYIDYDDSGPKTLFRHHFAKSTDSGAHWSDEVLQSMDPTGIENADDGYLWGDYEGLTAAGNMFYGAFTGASVNRRVSQLDPIFFARPSK